MLFPALLKEKSRSLMCQPLEKMGGHYTKEILAKEGEAQYGREKSNKSVEDKDETFAGLKSTLKTFRIYFFQNPTSKGVESTS